MRTMTHAIRVIAIGGPDQLQWEEVAVAAPAPGEVRIVQAAVGLNYIDVNPMIKITNIVARLLVAALAAGGVH